MNDTKEHIDCLDDSVFTKSPDELREEYKKMTGHYPEPLTEQQKKEYGLI